ncbi:MAG: IS4 family transposase [Alphaproteobacteria bacterium]|nr:IS4 family transposase [Alphaproteobacteria bacterium]
MAQVEVSYRRMTVRPPIGKQKRYPTLVLTLLHAREPQEPVGRPRIDWKLITDLPVDSHDDAVEKLRWYAVRWKIEVFHKILKSDCRAEQARLRTAERLVRLIAVFCILSWRVFWLTMLNRTKPDLEPALVLTEIEIRLLDRLIPDRGAGPSTPKTLSDYLTKIAWLGGYLARTKDPPPGNIVMWRGLARLNDVTLGATMQADVVGN